MSPRSNDCAQRQILWLHLLSLHACRSRSVELHSGGEVKMLCILWLPLGCRFICHYLVVTGCHLCCSPSLEWRSHRRHWIEMGWSGESMAMHAHVHYYAYDNSHEPSLSLGSYNWQSRRGQCSSSSIWWLWQPHAERGRGVLSRRALVLHSPSWNSSKRLSTSKWCVEYIIHHDLDSDITCIHIAILLICCFWCPFAFSICISMLLSDNVFVDICAE